MQDLDALSLDNYRVGLLFTNMLLARNEIPTLNFGMALLANKAHWVFLVGKERLDQVFETHYRQIGIIIGHKYNT